LIVAEDFYHRPSELNRGLESSPRATLRGEKFFQLENWAFLQVDPD
jgi:hypothetical protein